MSIFINTRPSDRADALTQKVSEYGHTVVALPLLKMTPTELTKANKQQLANLIKNNEQFNNYHVLVVVSPTAAQLAINYLKGLIPNNQNIKKLLANINVVAVGQATATVLSNAGINTVVPKLASNEGMLELEEISGLTHQNRVMIWRGQGGRKLLINELTKKNIAVDVVEWYARTLPSTTLPQYQQWVKNHCVDATLADKKVTVLISSGEAFEHWQNMVTTLGNPKLTDFDYVVLGERLINLMVKLHGNNLTTKKIDSLDPQTVAKALS